jgi:hypothetical protein
VGLGEHEREHVRDRAPLYDDGAVHIGFAESKLGIDQNPTFDRWRSETDRGLRSRAIAKRHG